MTNNFFYFYFYLCSCCCCCCCFGKRFLLNAKPEWIVALHICMHIRNSWTYVYMHATEKVTWTVTIIVNQKSTRCCCLWEWTKHGRVTGTCCNMAIFIWTCSMPFLNNKKKWKRDTWVSLLINLLINDFIIIWRKLIVEWIKIGDIINYFRVKFLSYTQ